MISFSYNSETNELAIEDDFHKSLKLSDSEKSAVEIIFSFLPPDLLKFVSVEQRSKDYISFLCGANDFLRLKYGTRSKWLSLRLPRDVAAHNIENPLFAAQVNKKSLHWRASLSSLDDLSKFSNLVSASCVYMSE